jgi:hypothetical protein
MPVRPRLPGTLFQPEVDDLPDATAFVRSNSSLWALGERIGLFSPFELSPTKNLYTKCDLSDEIAPVVG